VPTGGDSPRGTGVGRTRIGWLLGNLRRGSLLLSRSGPACRLGWPELHVTAHASVLAIVPGGQLAEMPMREGRLVAGQCAPSATRRLGAGARLIPG